MVAENIIMKSLELKTNYIMVIVIERYLFSKKSRNENYLRY